MKPYLLFTWETYYPEGATNDFERDFDTIEEAKAAAPAEVDGYEGHILIVEHGTMKTVAEAYYWKTPRKPLEITWEKDGTE